MTASPADRQRLKRQRRAEAGMVKVEAWLSPDNARHLESIKADFGLTTDQAVNYAVMMADLANQST